MEKLEVIGEVVNGDLVIREEDQVAVAPMETAQLVTQEMVTMKEMMEFAQMLSQSTIVPVAYQRRPENCYIALDMANRMGCSVFIIMQNLHVIQGKPSFSGSAIGAMIKSNPALTDVELVYVGTPNTDTWGAYVTAIRKKNGKVLKGGTVTIAIAKKEGWYQKSGSKWQTMPELMLAYRAYAWFGRVHTPETMMGLHSVEEIEDTGKVAPGSTGVQNPYEK